MPIVQQGSINTTALVVPGLYVQIVPPQLMTPNGVPTNVIGVVGTASYGPVNQPVICSSMADYARSFGPIRNQKYDAGTQVATAVLQGASNFRVVRVTDGTDTKASVVIGSTSITFTARYSGTVGNSITATIAAGSAASSFKLVIGLPGQQPEVFDNITGSGNALWVAMAAAVNTGNGAMRGPSNIVTAAAGVGTTAPTLATTPLTGGTDGTTTITEAVIIGVDTASRSGMYALRGQGCTIALLADADGGTGGTSNTWSTQGAFGLAEGIYMICTGPAGDSIATATAQKATSGIDNYAVKLMFGDWLYWQDPVNAVTRLVSPQGFVAGRLGNLSPEQSSLNKQLYGIVGSQKQGLASSQVTTYSDAELQALFTAGLDVIANPAPGGAYWAVRCGHNSSSNAATNGDNYTRMTNYIASTLNSAMGIYVGQTISSTLFQRIRASILSYLGNLLQQGVLGSTDGNLPYSAICDISNNPLSRTGLGYVQADVQVRYLAINEKFIVNVEGGQTVVVTRQTTQPANGTNTPAF